MNEEHPIFQLAFYGQVASGVLKRVLSVHGLRPGHAHVLTLLSTHGPLGQQDLLERLGVDPSVLVTLLNDLESDRMVERRRNPADRRRHIVVLTGSGEEMTQRIEQSFDVAAAELFADLDPAEVATLTSLLPRIRTKGTFSCDEPPDC